MANIREIAKKAGVSVATVSRYLNDFEKVAPETREKIRKVIEEENYHTNGLISSFFKNKTNMFGLIVQDLNNPFFPEITEVISTQAFNNGYSVLLCNAQNKHEIEEMHIKKLLEMRVDGLIVFNTVDSSLYSKVDIPIISVETPIENAVHVEFDNYKGGKLAAESLNECDNVLILDGPAHLKPVRDRIKSFVNSCTTEFDIIDYSEYDDTKFDLIDFSRYDGVFGWNDLAIYKYIKYLQKHNIDNEFKIVGYDNISMNKFLPYDFYTIDQNLYTISNTIVQLITEYVDKKIKPENIIIDVKLVKKDE